MNTKLFTTVLATAIALPLATASRSIPAVTGVDSVADFRQTPARPVSAAVATPSSTIGQLIVDGAG